MPARQASSWRPLNAVLIIGLAIAAGIIASLLISAGQSEASLYQFACLHYGGCFRQYAYVHTEDGLASLLGGITVSVTVAYTLVYVSRRPDLRTPRAVFCGDLDIRVAIRECMTELPYGLGSATYPLFRLLPQKEFAEQMAKTGTSGVRAAALLLETGVKYSPCDFIAARELLKEKYGDGFRHLCVASVDYGARDIMAAADISEGFALALHEYYAIKEFLDLIATGANLISELAARHFAVDRIGIKGSLSDVLTTLARTAGSDALVCAERDRVIGMISFAKITACLAQCRG